MIEIVTKINKSKTLIFNWIATIIPLILETSYVKRNLRYNK